MAGYYGTVFFLCRLIIFKWKTVVNNIYAGTKEILESHPFLNWNPANLNKKTYQLNTVNSSEMIYLGRRKQRQPFWIDNGPKAFNESVGLVLYLRVHTEVRHQMYVVYSVSVKKQLNII